MSATLQELRGQLQDRREKAAAIFVEGGDDMDLTAEQVDEVRALNDEMTDLSRQIEQKEGLVAIKSTIDELDEVKSPMVHAVAGRPTEQPDKTIGQLFVESKAYEGRARTKGDPGVEAQFDVDVKATLFQTSAGWAPPTVRSAVVVPYQVRALVVADLFPVVNVSLPTYLYMEETTFTNSAAETSEGSAKPESALALTERTENIRKIATYLPVTDEQLDDVPAARSYVDNRLGYMVSARLDSELLVGDGTAPNISGILDRSIQTQALGTDAKPDAVYKAMTKIRATATTSFNEPNASIFHPNDWQDFRLLRTADGIYIWGSPSDAGPERIWGLRVVQTVAITEGTALVGDFNQAALLLREGLTMKAGYVNDDLIKNRLTIVAELRAGLAVYVPGAFCSVTGL